MNSWAGVVEELTLFLPSQKSHVLKVERVTSEKELVLGLMNRSEWGKISGMLFDFGRKVRSGFWMKNTLLPLDLLFLDEKGQVIFIHEGMKPESLEVVTPLKKYRAALELPEGFVQKLSITLQTVVKHPIFSP